MLYLILFFIFFVALAVTWLFKMHFLRQQVVRLASSAILRKITDKPREVYFSTDAIRQAVDFLLFFPTKKAKSAIFFLCYGKTEAARQFLSEHRQQYTAAVLSGFYNQQLAEELFSELGENENAKAQIAICAFMQQKKDKAQTLINNLKINKLSAAEKAAVLYCRSWFALSVGDLLNASEDCTAAISLFQKKDCFYEEARAYWFLGEIYRFSAASDSAEFMYKTALELAEKQNYPSLQADIFGSLGMLYTGEERFEEASDSFLRSLDINHKLMRDESCANLYNQLALLKLLEKKFEEAEDYISQALNFSILSANALSFEIMAKIHFAKERFEDASKYAEEAQKKYWKCRNLTAYFEALYLDGLACFNLKNFDETEQKLRHLIDVANENETSFHIANAYSLLGMVFLNRGDLSRAKTFVEESARRELKNNRIDGLVSDYINLGLIAKQSGDDETAQKYFEQAKLCAEQTQDANLMEATEKYIKAS